MLKKIVLMMSLASASAYAQQAPFVVNAEAWETHQTTPSLAAAAQYTGVYALADPGSNIVEVFDINKKLKATMTQEQLESATIGSVSSHGLGIKGVSLTPSGRLMFVSVKTDEGLEVVRYNLNTQEAVNFALIDTKESNFDSTTLGLLHHKGSLYIGDNEGQIHKVQAQRNDLVAVSESVISVSDVPVTSIAVDRETNEIYASSGDSVISVSSGATLAELDGLKSLTYGRTYGREGIGGLYLLKDTDDETSELHYITTAMLQGDEPVQVSMYSEINEVNSIAATADGKILSASDGAFLLSDADDNHLSYEQWLQYEYDNYVQFIQTLVSPVWMNGEGWVSGANATPGINQMSISATAGAAWAVIALIAHEELSGDSQEQYVTDIIKRFGGTADDGIVPELDKDGQFFANYNDDGSGVAHSGEKTVSIYATSKIVHAALRAKAYYSDNAEIVAAADNMISKQRNYSDYVREYGNVEMSGTLDGPFPRHLIRNGYGYQESYLFAELAGAMDPMSQTAYKTWWTDYEGFNQQKTYLQEETVIKYNISSFVEQYGHIVFESRRVDDGWKKNYSNLYAHYSAWTDDNAVDYMTVFSAGATKTAGYSADKIENHPDTISHFPGLLGFGIYGETAPMVGGYFAYRDDASQQFTNNDDTLGASILARYSNEYPDFAPRHLALADSHYGFFGLVEHLAKLQGRDSIIDSVIARDSKPSDFKVGLERSTDSEHILGEGLSEQVYIENHDFEDKKNGWTQNGDFAFYTPNKEGVSIDGHSGEIRTNSDVKSHFGSYSQIIDAGSIQDMTPFVIRAEARILNPDAQDDAYLRIDWFNHEQKLITSKSNILNSNAYPSEDATQADMDLTLLTYKPVGATHAELHYEVERNLELTPRYNRYLVDNITMTHANHMMEDLGEWTVGGGTIHTATIHDDSIEMNLISGTANQEYVEVYKDFAIDATDPAGTRYIVTANVDADIHRNSELLMYYRITNADGSFEDRLEGGDAIKSSKDGLTLFASGRKLEDGEDTFRAVFRFKRKSGINSPDESVIIRDITVSKQHR